MAKCLFVVRAVVADQLREKFDHWYSTDHLSWATRIFKCEKAQRFWSETAMSLLWLKGNILNVKRGEWAQRRARLFVHN